MDPRIQLEHDLITERVTETPPAGPDEEPVESTSPTPTVLPAEPTEQNEGNVRPSRFEEPKLDRRVELEDDHITEPAVETSTPPTDEEPVESTPVAPRELPAEKPLLDVAAITQSFASVRRSLDEFDAALIHSTANLRIPPVASDGFSDDMKRAIIETAENTKRLVERSRSGGLVFS